MTQKTLRTEIVAGVTTFFTMALVGAMMFKSVAGMPLKKNDISAVTASDSQKVLNVALGSRLRAFCSSSLSRLKSHFFTPKAGFLPVTRQGF